jgi:hypothetical protein
MMCSLLTVLRLNFAKLECGDSLINVALIFVVEKHLRIRAWRRQASLGIGTENYG